jgi:hypothetical protein
MTTSTVVTLGSGKTIQTFADLRAFMAAHDLSGEDVNYFMTISGGFEWNDGTAGGVIPRNPTDKNRYNFIPALDQNPNIMGIGAFDYVSNAAYIKFARDSNRLINPGMTFRDLGFLFTGTSSSQGFRSINTNSNISDYDFISERCRWLNQGSSGGIPATLSNNNSRTLLRNNLMINEGSQAQMVGDGGIVRFRSEGNLYVARGAALNSPQAIGLGSAGVSVDDVFVGWGAVVIDRPSSSAVVTNAFSSSTPSNMAGFTVADISALVTSAVSPYDYSIPANSPLIGAGSAANQKTYDILGNYRGTLPDVGPKQRNVQALPAKANTTVTDVTVIGQRVRVDYTFSSSADSTTVTLLAGSTPNGAIEISGPGVKNADGASGYAIINGVLPGNYSGVKALSTNGSGVGTSSGGKAFVIAVPAQPTITVLSQSKSGQTITVKGNSTGNPVSGSFTLPADPTAPNGASTKGPLALSFADDGTWTLSIPSVAYGTYAASTASATNYTATANTTGPAITLYAPGSQPPGLPAVDLAPYSVPVFNSPSIANGGVITTLVLENTTAAVATNQPFTIGHPFKKGQLKVTDSLIGKISGQSDLALQFDMKATWPDGSVRHAMISGIIPSIAASALVPMDLVRSTSARNNTPTPASAIVSSAINAVAKATIAGVLYTADMDAGLSAGTGVQQWIAGPVCTEYLVEVPFKAADGTLHAALKAQFSVRYYPTLGKAKIDVAYENGDVFAPVADITYDAVTTIGGTDVYTKSGLVHWMACRWKQTFWYNGETALHIKFNVPYLIDTKIVPNYDRSLVIPESRLANRVSLLSSNNFGPMGNGVMTPYMPTTGGRPEIGPHPQWAVEWLLSQDKRARKFTLLSADVAGSWPIHLRDRSTGPAAGQPFDVMHFPYATKAGGYGDANNPLTGKNEHMTGGDSANNTTPDVGHHPAAGNLAYLLTGDAYYLDEVKFWTSYCSWNEHPGYREREKALVAAGQLRGQAWTLRDLAFLTYLLPDNDILKPTYKYFLDSNIAWFNAQYSDNPTASPIGAITNGYAVAYAVTGSPEFNGVSMWQDAFFTYAIGHAVELGCTEAERLLRYKSKLSLGVMLDPGYCYIHAATYALAVRDWNGNDVQSFAQAWQLTATAAMQTKECASQAMADQIQAELNSVPRIIKGEIFGFAASAIGYVANFQIGLATAVDSGLPNADLAWTLYQSRTVKQDYANDGATFAIQPRSYNAVSVTVPSTPTGVIATASAGSASVTGNVAGNGGSPITGYTATASTGQSSSSTTLPVVVLIPAGATGVTFTLVAVNAVGASPSSSPSDAITVPPAPVADTTRPTMVGSLAQSNVTTSSYTITCPIASDNVAVGGYERSFDNGTTWVDLGTDRTYTRTGLSANTAYSNSVRAYDTAGNRALTALTLSVTTASVASTVTGVTVSPTTATGSTNFTASVQGTNSPSQAVTWSKTGGGTLSSSGQFVEPAKTSSVQTIVVTAKSVQDGTTVGTATVTIAAADVVVTPSPRTVRVVLGTETGPAANLVDCRVSFHAATGPHNTMLALYQSATETTDSAGMMEFTMYTTAVAIGDTGLLSVLMPNGRHYLGIATVS